MLFERQYFTLALAVIDDNNLCLWQRLVPSPSKDEYLVKVRNQR